MMTNKEHIDFETLNELVDGQLDLRATNVVEQHLAECQSCSLEYATLQKLLAATKALPRSVLPPDDVWPDLKEVLNCRKEVALPTSNQHAARAPEARPVQASPWLSRARLAAAAIVLVVLSSGITAIVLRSGTDRRIAERPDAIQPSQPGSVSTLPVAFRQAESEYNRTIAELKLAVDTQRSQLSPETVRTIDHSLAVVDSAIAEARAALMADPNSRVLVDLLSASYQRKLDLLRRTSELGSRI